MSAGDDLAQSMDTAFANVADIAREAGFVRGLVTAHRLLTARPHASAHEIRDQLFQIISRADTARLANMPSEEIFREVSA